MIVKGNARGGGAQLAAHLMNAHDNERVELVETRGSIAADLAGAFAEWRAQATATACEKYLYSLSVNPDQAQGRMARADYLAFLARVERKLGLDRQGRIVVFHEKRDRDGIAREHCHAVWSRIDARAGRAVQLSHDRMKLRDVARAFAREMGRRLPPGLENDRGEQRHQARAGHRDLREQQQEERSGITKEDRRAAITRAWLATRDGAGFAAALREAGYEIAQGDRRAFVVVDRAGEVHALGRQVAGVRSAEIAARLETAGAAAPSVAEAVAASRSRRETAERRVASPAPNADRRRETLRDAQQARRTNLATERASMEKRHEQERIALVDAQRLTHAFREARDGPRRISAFIRRTVAKVRQQHREKVLGRRQLAEQRDLDRRERALVALDKREAWGLDTRFRRERFQTFARAADRHQARTRLPAGIAEPVPSRGPDRAAVPAMPVEERRSRLREAFAAERMPPPAEPVRDTGPDHDEQRRAAEAQRRAQERKPER